MREAHIYVEKRFLENTLGRGEVSSTKRGVFTPLGGLRGVNKYHG